MKRISTIAKLFTFNRPINREDPSCESRIFGFPKSSDLIAGFNRLEPYLISGPSTQGKTSLLYWLRNLIATPEFGAFACCWISPPARAFASREDLAGFLALSIDSNPRAIDFAELLYASDLLRGYVAQGQCTALLIDASQCGNRDTLGWLVHNTFLMANELRELAHDKRALILLSGNYEIAALGTGPTAPYAIQQLILRNLTFPETQSLCERVERAAEPYGGVRFEQDATQALFAETSGDKYHTNVLGATAVCRLHKVPRSGPLVVTESHVVAAADQMRAGLVDADRIRWGVQKVIGDREKPIREEAAEALSTLIELGSDSWYTISNELRRELFDAGLVGPVIADGNGTPGAFALLQRIKDNRASIRYGIRDRMVASLILREIRTRTEIKASDEWRLRNLQRLDLIDKKFAEGLTRCEEDALKRLQAEAAAHIDSVARLPSQQVEDLKEQVRRISRDTEDLDG